jgi:hypothetical protein
LRRCSMEHRELLEQHEARLRLYVRLMDGTHGAGDDAGYRGTVLDVVRREIAAMDKVAEIHLRHLSGDEQREAFRYAMALLLPYYTHLARIYGERRRGVVGSGGRVRAH